MGNVALTLLLAALMPWALVLIYYDLRYFRLPNLMTMAGGAVMVCLAALNSDFSSFDSWIREFSLCLAPGILWILIYLCFVRCGIGWGDIKLALPLGILLGLAFDNWLEALLFSIMAASLLSIIFFIFVRSSARLGRFHHYVPHGPSMLLATGFMVLCALLA
ncbi:MAG: prepilin peptidase [Corynebacterium sp.]|nr:prepilin peptidase [Corynebacterium sp.]